MKTALFLAVAAVAAACTSAPEPDVLAARALPAAIASDAEAVVAANNDFALDVYAELPAAQNTFFSPFSIATALAMLDAGAAGQTDAEIRTALHAPLPGDRLSAAYGALITSLDVGRGFGNYTLATADRLFGEVGFPFLESYLDLTNTDYGAQLQTVDFAGDNSGATQTIDNWVSGQTDGKIPQLFPPGSISPSCVLALVNAILFKGTWAQQFDPNQTQTTAFHVANGSDVQAPLMSASEPIAITRLGSATLGAVPFAGGDLAMVLIVPDDPDGLPAVEASLTGAGIGSALAAATAMTTNVELPKLQLDEAYVLDSILNALGIVSAYEPHVADFSGIDGGDDLYVGTARHDAALTVDEQGAEAAAATGITLNTDGGEAGPSLELIADHSFVLLIYDNVTGSILFMGRIQDPTKSS